MRHTPVGGINSDSRPTLHSMIQFTVLHNQMRLLLLISLIVIPSSMFGRIWSDHKGRTFEGSLVEKKEYYAVIERTSDGQVFDVEVKTLSVEDQQYLRYYTNHSSNPLIETLKQLEIFEGGNSTPSVGLLATADLLGFVVLLMSMSYSGKKLGFPDWGFIKSLLFLIINALLFVVSNLVAAIAI